MHTHYHACSSKRQLAESNAARSAAEAAAEEARAAAAAAGERLALKETELADWKALDSERKERLKAKEANLEALHQVGVWITYVCVGPR